MIYYIATITAILVVIGLYAYYKSSSGTDSQNQSDSQPLPSTPTPEEVDCKYQTTVQNALLKVSKSPNCPTLYTPTDITGNGIQLPYHDYKLTWYDANNTDIANNSVKMSDDNDKLQILKRAPLYHFTYIFSENPAENTSPTNPAIYIHMDRIDFVTEGSDWNAFNLWVLDSEAKSSTKVLTNFNSSKPDTITDDMTMLEYPYQFEFGDAVVFKRKEGNLYYTTIIFKTISNTRRGNAFAMEFGMNNYDNTFVRCVKSSPTDISFVESNRS
jgi:hypothetical protein